MIHSLHFVGVGGIGMSALARMSASLGIVTTGSDRAAASPENARIINALKNGGVRIFPQDGSVYDTVKPDAIVYSTAIEEDNPDFAAAPSGTQRMHRSDALKFLVEAVHAENMIAVSGTCGKTSVSAHLAEALYHLNEDPGVLCGGLVNAFVSPDLAGNFRAGAGKTFVVEADESDKSLLHYTPDTAVILNIGTDHYSREELAEVFRKFVSSARKRIVLAAELLDDIGADACAGRDTILFSGDPASPPVIQGFPVVRLDSYRAGADGAFCSFDGQQEIPLRAPGRHNALNALAVYATLIQAGFPKKDAALATGSFSGVWRRFDHTGKLSGGCRVYDDYAHNPEKIISCLEAAQSISAGKVILLFQPHGFKPLRDMHPTLFEMLQDHLGPEDIFGLLPVYYAGGTASFTPTSEEIAASFRERSGKAETYPYFADRTAAEIFLQTHAEAGDTAVIMGARDNSLSIWAKKITEIT